MRTHKLRSILTTLGIILGIAAVIAVVTLTASFQAYFEQQFTGTFAPDAFSVLPGRISTGAAQAGFFTTPISVFTDRDVSEVSKIGAVRAVIPFGIIQLSPAEGVQLGNSSIVTLVGISVRATVPNAFNYGLIKVDSGTGFGNNPNQTVVGHDIARAMIDQLGSSNLQDALDKTLRFNFADGRKFNFTVVGILKDVPTSDVSSQLLVPVNPYYNETRTPPGTSQSVRVYAGITVSVSSVSQVKATEDAVMNYLRNSSDAQKFLSRDAPQLQLIIISQDVVISFIETQLGQFGSLVASVGLVSLVVGSIGISNIMMVSVTERTREIGVMKATGARKRDVLQLFLLESSIMSVIGALIGVASGIGLGYLLTQSGLFAGLQLPLTFRLEWFPISVAVGVLVGILSGLYPAWRAARINPVQALRFE